MKKQDYIDIDNDTPVVARAKKYLVTISGGEQGMLQNKLPDLNISKAEKKQQAKSDPAEIERLEWRKKIHVGLNGNACIPGENIHESLKEGAGYWGQKIAGEGNRTYAKVVAASVICESLDLGMSPNDERIIPFGKACNGNPSKGKKSGCRVYKIRPMFRPWGGTFIMHVFDQRLTPAVLRNVLEFAGTFVGIGDWRPVFGRYDIVSVEEV
jgi:hypothetical protein